MSYFDERFVGVSMYKQKLIRGFSTPYEFLVQVNVGD